MYLHFMWFVGINKGRRLLKCAIKEGENLSEAYSQYVPEPMLTSLELSPEPFF